MQVEGPKLTGLLFSGGIVSTAHQPVDVNAIIQASGQQRLRGETVERLMIQAPKARFDVGIALRVLDECLRDPAGVLNLTAIGRRLSLDPRTVDQYLDLLQRRHMLHFVPNLESNANSNIRSRAKVYPVGVGQSVESLRRADPQLLAQPDVANRLLESWVVDQIVPRLEEGVRPYYWRTPKGDKQVDVVLAGQGGKVVGLQVRSREQVVPQDAPGLRALTAAHDLAAGYVIYLGARIVRLNNRCWALPAAALAG